MGRDFLGNFNVSSDMQFSRGILLLDDMEGTDLWTASGNAGDYDVSLDTAAAFFGTKGLNMKSRVTSPASGDYVKALRLIPFPGSDLCVIRFRVCLPDVSKLDKFRLLVQFFRSSRSRIAGLEYHPNDPDLKYQDSVAGWTVLSGYDQAVVDGEWFTMELALDLATAKYIHVELNGIRTDFTEPFFDNSDASGYRYCQFSFYAYTAGAAAVSAYVDAVYCGEFLDV